jgi:outer membrane receptor protein involved in Fe transport
MDDTVTRIFSTVCSTCGQQGQYRPNELFGLENQLNFRPAENLDVTAGAAVERENLARYLATTYSGDPLVRPPAPDSPPMASNELLSLYAQVRYGLSPDLKLTGGLRHDNSSNYGKVNTPRASLVFNRGKLTLKLLYAEAFRAPKPWDYTYGAGNSGLDPEQMRSTELSGAYSFSGNLRADLSLYRNKLDNILELDSAANRYVNSGDIETLGLEAQLEFARGPFKGRASYTRQSSEDEEGSDVAEIARHGAGVGLFYAFGRQVKLGLEGRWLGSRRNTGTKPSAGAAFVTDATFSFLKSKNLSARLIGKNIFNERYYHTSNRPPDRYRQPQRQILIQAGYAFGL